MDLNFEYIAAHISDYINNENFFDTFDMRDIKIIMKNSHLTADQYVTLLKQSSSTLNSKELYICTRKANVRVQNLEEIVSILNSVKRYMKFNIFDGITDFLKQNEKVINDSTNERETFQDKSKAFQKENENATKDTTVNVTNENYNHSRDILTKITELKNSSDFETVYKFLDELSSTGNHEMISKSVEEGLWKKITPKIYEYYYRERNVLHFASEKGNLRLVQSLIECGCDKEAKDNFCGCTPLIWATENGHLEVVKYLISVGANKEAKDNNGYTPLVWASEEGHLEVVKYLISVGADKEAKNNNGSTPLIQASYNGHLEVVKHLISVGADKEAKNKSGWTPLIWASRYCKLEVVQYLISVGADKEAKNKYGNTPLIFASQHDHLEVVKYLISVGADKEAKNNNGKTALDVASGSVKKYFLEDKTK
ncbi:ankyrin repeat protein, putative [Trichomonas vaginalis G3]|uniref:Ankyrin repeat protein, putative n=1 Tax=Trichomonas vaginalis (strain ATCC PRA-98 / G3) TaxID=412133 RepID=A2GDG4_TRIV3|nr:ankyrin repeat protein family [Trichomonas vaginalis G3]EAX84802.1 ankyrin repeat protein, putative [Trichomonas vaginalis G3]KAI5546813.1 ankyrin repeat protein family [Trichomonas vaginalis G3]|eukprot:XP_001297732.1 ankyrin repeat protein [Trichomonas vaginalis G3]